ncbi:MAG: cadherin-like domain-containing protein [Chloroflexi bacterium]|nr:cadherin-like domain-containing protein [Chloroflexota bacterium]
MTNVNMNQERSWKKWSGAWPPLVLLLLLFVGLLALAQGRVAAAPEPIPPAPEAALTCGINPFSSGYDLFGEDEILVGYTSGDFVGNRLSNFSLNLEEWGLAERNLFLEETAVWGANIQSQTAVAADLDGDGYTEMVQSFVTTNASQPGYYIAVFNPVYGVTYSKLSATSHGRLVAASGNILGDDNQREQVVLAAVNNATGALTIEVWDGARNGMTAVPLASFRSTTGLHANAGGLDVAVGNLTNDRQDDIVISLLDENRTTVELLTLTYDPTYVSGSGSNQANKLRPLDSDSFSAGQFRDIQVTLLRLNGDFQDEIVVAADSYQNSTPNVSPQIQLFVYKYNAPLQTLTRFTNLDAAIPAYATNFSLSSGDINGQMVGETGVSPEEVVVGFSSTGSYEFGSGFAVEVWRAQGLNTPNPTLARYEQWITNNDQRNQAGYLSIAVADLDNDGLKEIVAALDDGRGLEVLYLTHDDLLADAPDVPFGQSVNLDPTALNGKTAVAVGDRDNNALKAIATAECQEIVEQRVTAVTFAPPYWGIIQDMSAKGAAIGRTLNNQTATSTALTYYRSDTVSGYVGAAVGGSYGPFSIEASARLTAAESKERSSTEGGTTGTGESLQVQRTGNDDFLTFDNTAYDCYAYTLSQNGVSIPETALRNCDYVSSTRLATDLEAWDNTWGAQPGGINQALTWTPVARDWASLGLFRGSFAAQSSTFSSHSADRAVDGTLRSSPANNSIATTNTQDNPWWQIDLGSTQPIAKVRLWNRTDWLTCADLAACPNQLDHIYVLISASDFRNMPEEGNPAALMARPDVYAFSLDDFTSALVGVSAANPLGEVTTFQTLDSSIPPQPVQGRFVRVQRVLPNAQLSLGEVQVFGLNHVNPDRYPVNIREKGTPTDGLFEVQLHNPLGTTPATTWPWVEVRGNLLWNRTGYANGVLSGDMISLGNAGINWTYSSYSLGSSFATNSLKHETRIGAEFDFTTGAIFQMQVGYGEEFTTGTIAEHTTETSWTDAIEFGGRVDGFPSAYNGQSWVLGCGYEIRPYYYELIETSTFGLETRYPVLDYIVPDVSVTDPLGNNSAGLNRTNSTAVANCVNGNQTGGTPQATNDEGTLGAGGAATFNVLANDIGNQLRIVNVTAPQSGQVTFSDRTITYVPNSGFVGTDTFTYTVSDGVTTSEGVLTVVVTLREVFLPVTIR